MTDRVRIQDLHVDCIIGIFGSERQEPQSVVVDIVFDVDLRTAGRTGRICATVDYGQVAVEVAALLEFRRYQLLEAAVEELAAMLLGLHPAAVAVELTLRKPAALARFGAVAQVSIRRERTDFPRRHEASRFGEVEVLLETREAGLYLLHVEAGKAIPSHRHAVMRELEWLVAGQLTQRGKNVELVQPQSWARDKVHDYLNPSSARATLFCCDTPPFIPEDEILAQGIAAEERLAQGHKQ